MPIFKCPFAACEEVCANAAQYGRHILMYHVCTTCGKYLPLGCVCSGPSSRILSDSVASTQETPTAVNSQQQHALDLTVSPRRNQPTTRRPLVSVEPLDLTTPKPIEREYRPRQLAIQQISALDLSSPNKCNNENMYFDSNDDDYLIDQMDILMDFDNDDQFYASLDEQLLIEADNRKRSNTDTTDMINSKRQKHIVNNNIVDDTNDAEITVEDNSQSTLDMETPSLELTYNLVLGRHCPLCDILFAYRTAFQNHIATIHPELHDNSEMPQIGAGVTTFPITLQEQAFNLYYVYRAELGNHICKSVEGMFHSCLQQILNIFKEFTDRWANFTVQFEIVVNVSRKEGDEIIYMDKPYQSFLFPVLNSKQGLTAINLAIARLTNLIEELLVRGSGWTLEKIVSFCFTIAKFESFSGGAKKYKNLDNLPKPLQTKSRTLIDVPGHDNQCFKRAIYVHPDINNMEYKRKDNYKRPEWYESMYECDHCTKVQWDGITFPFSLDQIDHFEKINENIGVNIIGYSDSFKAKKFRKTPKNTDKIDQTINDVLNHLDDRRDDLSDEEHVDNTCQKTISSRDYRQSQDEIRSRCVPLHITKKVKTKNIVIDLLLLVGDEGEEDHFVYIKDIHSLLSTAKTKSNSLCLNCLQFLSTDFDTHTTFCSALGVQKTNYPKEESLFFNKYRRTLKVPFIIFADFESFCKPVEPITIVDEEMQMASTRVQYHKPSGFHCHVLNWKSETIAKLSYLAKDDNDDPARALLDYLIQKNAEIQIMLKEYEKQARKKMNISDEEMKIFKDKDTLRNKTCYFCNQKFEEGQTVVRHHSHLPDERGQFNFEGFAHAAPCNILAQVSKRIPVVFHNLKGYDGHMIINATSADIIKNIDVIPQSCEKFLSICINDNISFIDSFSFMSESLSKLVGTMNSVTDFSITREEFKAYNNYQIDLILRKGIYPYSYMTGVEKFKEECLPPKEAFRNDLTGEDIKDDDYEHAQKVWSEFGIQNLGEWTLLYCRTDVVLLADVWFKLRNTLYDAFGLDVGHYFSLAMFSLDAALKKTEVKLDYIKDSTMHVWLESAVRGGLVSVGDLRVAKANNHYLPDYNPMRPSTFIGYFDANNLYGGALSTYLPQKEFKWCSKKFLAKIQRNPTKFVMDIDDEAEFGYFLEVDINIPERLHDRLNSFPPCPTTRTIKTEDLSYVQDELRKKLGIPESSNQERLIADLNPKEHYVVHYRALKTYLSVGVEITNVHRAVQFVQSPWMKSYIDYNTMRRKNSSSPIEIAFWKLLNNTGYGKFVEQKRNRRRIQVILSAEQAIRYSKKATVDRQIIIRPGDSGIVLLVMKRLQVTLDRPIYAGICCLDESKRIMVNFHYNYIAKEYEGRYNLLYTDTDSLVYLLTTKNMYKDCQKNEDLYFDNSGYNKNCPYVGQYHSDKNKKRLCYFSDEVPEGIISEVIVNKPKMYCVRYILFSDLVNEKINHKVKMRAKGIAKSTVKNEFLFEHFANALLPENDSQVQTYATNKGIRSFKHQLYTVHTRKKALNGYDIKKYTPDGIIMLSWGHKDIKLYEGKVEAQQIASKFLESFREDYRNVQQ